MNDIIDRVSEYMTSTLFYFMETPESCYEGPMCDMMICEMDHMFMNSIAETYSLNDEERLRLDTAITELIRSQVKGVALKQYRGMSGSLFNMHTVLFTKPGSVPATHPCDKISVTAGCGSARWSEYTAAQQADVIEFVFGLTESVGTLDEPADIKVNEERYTVQVEVKELVNN